MTVDIQKLKALAEAAKEDLPDWQPDFGLTYRQKEFLISANPAAVLEVIKELEDYQQGARAEADAGDGARAELRQLKAENFDVHATLQAAKGEIERLKAENEALRKSLLEASEEVATWGAYASDYFQEKHDLAGCVARLHDAAMSKEASHD